MKAFLLLDMPESCLKCKISHYEAGDSEETLICPLLETEGNFQERLPDCPLKGLEE
ncbi:MAG TPA: hypothetical protein VF941_00190 [Clostridia bacterium]